MQVQDEDKEEEEDKGQEGIVILTALPFHLAFPSPSAYSA